ncbi:lipid A core-O-antigen ligase-like enyme [Rhizobium sp. CF122]|nr:lipid A core-O-antigen ligase-like enyme [Rhizobium sp. CF122]
MTTVHRYQPVDRPFRKPEISAQAAPEMVAQPNHGLALPVKLFLVGLVLPWIIPFGSLNLSAYRIVLLVAFVPCSVLWMQGRAGRIRLPDLGLTLFHLWAAVGLVVVHGIGPAIQPGGMLFIEGMGSYLMARCFIRTPDDFRSMVMFVSKLLVCLLPFCLYEWLTGQKPLLTILGTIFPTVEITRMYPRMGLWRVQGPFSHSILYGVFCASLLALVCRASSFRYNGFTAVFFTSVVVGSAVLSMSSAPIAGLALQIALLTWDRLLRGFPGRWKLLWAVAILGIGAIEFGSNQTPAQFYVSHFTFEQQTGWYRMWIWEYGTASVERHPIFGIGLGDWMRPGWMVSDSIDNFWLILAMRHGIPGVTLMVLSWFGLWFAIARRKVLEPVVASYRTAYLICMASFVFVGATVHFWGATYAWFFFLGGAGAWILDSRGHENPSGRTVSDRAAGGAPMRVSRLAARR